MARKGTREGRSRDGTTAVRIRKEDRERINKIRERLHRAYEARGFEAPDIGDVGIIRDGIRFYLRVLDGEVIATTPAQAREAAEALMAKFAEQVLREVAGIDAKAHRCDGAIAFEVEDGQGATVTVPAGLADPPEVPAMLAKVH